MATTIKAKTPEGVKSYKLEDVRPYFLYDTVTIATSNTDTEKYFFQTPENKTSIDTNLKQFSTIQIGWVFDVTKMRLIPKASMKLVDIEEIFDDSIITYLKEGDIEIFSMPGIMLNAGCGISGATTTADSDVISLGLPSNSAVEKLPFPLTIAGGKTFLFRWRFATAPTPTVEAKVRMVLEGILRRDIVGA
ncbi:MAG: hypothetical protein K6T73_01165 [Candidatus Bathyarchaeota archaeon]|nr:hypothetical protein [Candidatus Bathyarchaeota archaeon]